MVLLTLGMLHEVSVEYQSGITVRLTACLAQQAPARTQELSAQRFKTAPRWFFFMAGLSLARKRKLYRTAAKRYLLQACFQGMHKILNAVQAVEHYRCSLYPAA